MVARWKPVHLGHSRILRALQRSCGFLQIGIGSANQLDERNPFTAEESADMIRLVLKSGNYRIHELPDLGDGPRWGKMVAETFGPLDLFVTANSWVRQCVLPYYEVVHPVHFLSPEERIPLNATMVREAIKNGGDWRSMVEPEIADYLARKL